jgi:hypothetical protein
MSVRQHLRVTHLHGQLIAGQTLQPEFNVAEGTIERASLTAAASRIHTADATEGGGVRRNRRR